MKFFKEHKNLSLFIILILSLVITYIFEEKRLKNKEVMLQKKLAILDVDALGELKSFTGIKLNVVKKNEKYFAGDNNLLLSNKKLDEFLEILSGLKIKKVLTAEETKNIERSFYIPNNDLSLAFEFQKGTLKFTLGKKLDYDQTFYMEVERGNEKKMMIVSDESPDPNVYQSDEEYRRSGFKYQRLQMLFYLTNVFFYEAKLFNEYNYTDTRINFKTIEIATFRNKKYLVNFENSTTNPPVPNGLNYFDDNWVSFHRTLTNIEGKTVYYPYDAKKLQEPLSVLAIEDRDGRKYQLEMYKKYGSLPGYFLKTTFNGVLYELRQEDAKYFFTNVQDFWLKKIYPEQNEYQFTIMFPKESNHKFEVSIKDKEVFDGEVKNSKLNLVEMKKLIDFFKSHSDHVSELTEKPSDLVGKSVMKLYFANRNIDVILDENDVLVVDWNNKIKLHHYVGQTVPFGIKSSNYFEAK